MPSKKFCPFGFFSFYINKQASQAGGCHHCLEDQCALWEELEDENGNVYGQCAVLSISDSLRSAAESSQKNLLRQSYVPDSTDSIPVPDSSNIGGAVDGSKLSLTDIFKRIRMPDFPAPTSSSASVSASVSESVSPILPTPPTIPVSPPLISPIPPPSSPPPPLPVTSVSNSVVAASESDVKQ